MACVLPFRPWDFPALRVFELRVARGQSTNPLQTLSCAYAPPQRLAPKPVAAREERGNPAPVARLLASSRGPSACPNRGTLLFTRLAPGVWKAMPCPPKVPPPGFGYPLGGVSPSALGSLFQLPTLLGFALQSLSPTPRRPHGFPQKFRPYAFPPNPSAWRRRSGGSRSRGQPCIPRPVQNSRPSGAVALLSLRTSRACVRRA